VMELENTVAVVVAMVEWLLSIQEVAIAGFVVDVEEEIEELVGIHKLELLLGIQQEHKMLVHILPEDIHIDTYTEFHHTVEEEETQINHMEPFVEVVDVAAFEEQLVVDAGFEELVAVVVEEVVEPVDLDIEEVFAVLVADGSKDLGYLFDQYFQQHLYSHCPLH